MTARRELTRQGIGFGGQSQARCNTRTSSPLCRESAMVPGVRVTMTVARVLRLFLDEPDASHYGLELMKATGFRSGTLYPVLARLERAGWIRSQREDIDPVAEGRPARR